MQPTVELFIRHQCLFFSLPSVNQKQTDESKKTRARNNNGQLDVRFPPGDQLGVWVGCESPVAVRLFQGRKRCGALAFLYQRI